MLLNIPQVHQTLQPLQQRSAQFQNVSGVAIENSDLKQSPPVSKLHAYAQVLQAPIKFVNFLLSGNSQGWPDI